MMKTLVNLLLLCAVAFGHVVKEGDHHDDNLQRHIAAGRTQDAAASPCYTQAFTGYSQTGYYYTFRNYVSDLSRVGFDNAICSVKETGMWMYYENKEYNKYIAGKVYWVHGVDIMVDFPRQYCRISSSLKYGGNRHSLNEDSFTVYSGEYFTGDEFYGNINAPDLKVVSGAGSSIILTGKNPWTFYNGYSYSGQSFCFYPSTDTDQGSDGTVLNFGLYPSLISIGVPDNSFRSAAKGCYSTTVIKAPQMKAEERFSHGAWGVFDMNNELEN